jgi:hypothetical protein
MAKTDLIVNSFKVLKLSMEEISKVNEDFHTEPEPIPEGLCKVCGGLREVPIGQHLWRNEPWPDDAYAGKNGYSPYMRCHACNGEGMDGENI